jgi:DNA-binding XRE family transcriptional regulator
MPSVRQTFITGNQLRAARALAGWSQAKLGQKIGVNERQIRFLERRSETSRTSTRHDAAIARSFQAVGIELTLEPVGVRLTESH